MHFVSSILAMACIMMTAIMVLAVMVSIARFVLSAELRVHWAMLLMMLRLVVVIENAG